MDEEVLELLKRFVEAHEKIAQQAKDLNDILSHNNSPFALDILYKHFERVADCLEDIHTS